MKVLSVIQARMGSTRLPGKVLLPIGNYPALYHTVKRTEAAGYPVVLAIPFTDLDLVSFARRYELTVYRGPLHDVLARYAGAVELHDADIIVRITGDCPLVDPQIIRDVVTRIEDGADYASNVYPYRTYPKGLDVQAFTADLLRRADAEATESYDREHACPWMERHASHIQSMTHHMDLSAHRWTLDTTDDYAFFRALAQRLPFEPPHPSTEEVLDVLKAEPYLLKLNAA